MKREDPLRWLKANGHDLAGLTGSDTLALRAIAALWELYAVERKSMVLPAVTLVLAHLQPKYHFFAKQLIAYSMDWSDREHLWSVVAPIGAGA